VTWQAIDTQEQLDELDRLVCWEDSELLEFHGGHTLRPYFPSDVSRSGYDRPDVHIVIAAPCGQKTDILELCLIHCDRLGEDAFERLHLRGRVDSLRRVEIASEDGTTLFRCARLIFRWRERTASDGGAHYFPRTERDG
jgi:hypothetical protein